LTFVPNGEGEPDAVEDEYGGEHCPNLELRFLWDDQSDQNNLRQEKECSKSVKISAAKEAENEDKDGVGI